MSGTYADLKVWQAAMGLALDVYRQTQSFPKEEIYGLTSQLRRAAVSVASNIAEGKGRFSDKELLHFLSQSRGSIFEIESQIIIAWRLGYFGQSTTDRLLKETAEVGRMINGLMKAPRPAPGLRVQSKPEA